MASLRARLTSLAQRWTARHVLAWCLVLAVSGCATIPDPAARSEAARQLAQAKGWHVLTLAASPFDLVAYVPHPVRNAATLTVYIEGDGLAWISRTQPSWDPTPVDPVALRLAMAQPQGAAAYLARPCQYKLRAGRACTARYWTGARFAPEVIDASNVALDQLKRRFQARRLVLVGYSGGATVAALLAARRTDVVELVTVAGIMDHRAWTAAHHLSPLTDSLDPVDSIPALLKVRQYDFVGGRDKVAPPALVQGFVDRFPVGRRPTVQLEADFDHRCCWAEKWAELWRLTRTP